MRQPNFRFHLRAGLLTSVLAAGLFCSAAASAQSSFDCPDPRAPHFEGFIQGATECRGVAGAYGSTNAFYTGYLDGQPGYVLNVAPGSISPNSTDAVNGGQLHALGVSIIDGLKPIQEAGEARSAALAGLAQAMTPGAGMIGMSMGGAGDATAFAFGASKSFDTHVIARAAGSFATQTKRVTWNVGIGYQF
ncbi:YadA-like family protein [Sphingomonas sp.]|uniref:YadA-like family protein n=1 Tax=Sphingomonas sp. TaxID=28214 RepID=UPI003B3BC980